MVESYFNIQFLRLYVCLPVRSTVCVRVQIIGNLIYYRYINSAIVAPDAFDIIDVGVVKGLTNDQRRNLGSVAKILQFAASNKGVSSASDVSNASCRSRCCCCCSCHGNRGRRGHH